MGKERRGGKGLASLFDFHKTKTGSDTEASLVELGTVETVDEGVRTQLLFWRAFIISKKGT